MEKIKTNKLDILNWCTNIEDEALAQAINLAEHPCTVGNICLMPDAHTGKGVPIGTVAAVENAVIPNVVGSDCGCGMLAVKTSLTDISTEQLKQIMGIIRTTIPVGKVHHKDAQESDIFNNPLWDNTVLCKTQKESARHQLGTLGGGNHFIELQKGSDGFIWFMIHSGSRNLGKRVGDYYNEKASELCLRWKQLRVTEDELPFIPVGEELFSKYINETKICLEFALENRKLMAERIKEAFVQIMPNVGFLDLINIHHNYAALENHFGKNVWVHRKGATLARQGTIGIIPGSQGTSSYIVEGLGNEASMCSCSHGAGRRMSRSKAKAELDLKQEQSLLDNKGIIHAIRCTNDLEEAASAYKNIDEVMENQIDLVKPIVQLTPLAVIKG